jgi:DNA-binding winged helix-turn-helix (wHTH) protein/tetratricopeptide (TPR) repeat protein
MPAHITAAETEFRFGRWCIDVEQRVLFLDGAPVSLAPRDFDLLLVLVRNAGRVVSKDELLKRVWGPVIVEEGNLASHVSVLREVLGRADGDLRYIETVPKRGYRFVCALRAAAEGVTEPGSTHVAVEAVPPAAVAPLAAPPLEPRRRRSNVRTWAYAAFAALVLVALAVGWRSSGDSVLPFAERDWLLVADFENQTGDARFDEALSTAFSVSLEQSQFMNVFPRSRVAATLERMRAAKDARLDESLAREVCARESIRALVTATVTRTGSEYALAARLVDPRTGAPRRSYLQRAAGETQLLAALQQIGTDLRRDLGESLASIQAADRPLAEVTTPSIEALRWYSTGDKHWREARYADAKRAYEAALAVDPEFAMAHAALGRVYYSYVFNRVDLGQEHFQRALALVDRTTARERLAMQADFAASRDEFDRAIELYQRYAALYPQDASVHESLGFVYAESGRQLEALESYRRALAVDAANAKLLNNAAVALAELDRSSEALPLFARALQVDPQFLDRHNFRANYATILFAAGERARAVETIRVALQQDGERDRASRLLGLFSQFEGRYREAAEHFARAVAAPDPDGDAALSRARNHGYLAAALGARGDVAGAKRELLAGVSALDQHRGAPANFRARLAIALVGAGAMNEAKAQLGVLEQAPGGNPGSASAVTLQLRGAIAAAGGHLPQAVSFGERALAAATTESDRLLIRHTLAHAYEKAGTLDRAIETYEALASAPLGTWLAWEAQEPCQLAQLALARLYAARGDFANARQRLEALRAFWPAPDADLPYLREVAALTAALGADRAPTVHPQLAQNITPPVRAAQ